MKHLQVAKNKMYGKMLAFFADKKNYTVWAKFKRLVNEIANFVSLTDKLPDYMQQHQLDIKGITAGKNTAFAALIKVTVNKAKKAYVWATDTKNDDLTQLFDVQKSDFDHMSESKAFTNLKNIRDAINKHIKDMADVELTAADINAIDKAITAYQQTSGTPAAAKAHKTEGTQAIADLMHPIDTSLGLIDNLMMSHYEDDKKLEDMLKEYLVNRQTDSLPTHHNGIQATITDFATGASLQGAIITLEGTGKTATSDINGIAEIIKLKTDTYNITISLAGYSTQTIKVTILRGKITELTVQLKKVV
jgi:predicted transglutaminase-like cysteine proteinase